MFFKNKKIYSSMKNKLSLNCLHKSNLHNEAKSGTPAAHIYLPIKGGSWLMFPGSPINKQSTVPFHSIWQSCIMDTCVMQNFWLISYIFTHVACSHAKFDTKYLTNHSFTCWQKPKILVYHGHGPIVLKCWTDAIAVTGLCWIEWNGTVVKWA